jgi:hypothetical protein
LEQLVVPSKDYLLVGQLFLEVQVQHQGQQHFQYKTVRVGLF